MPHKIEISDKTYENLREFCRLNDLKRRYPDVNIKSIARILHYSKDSVKEDLFYLKYMQEKGRCFEKMTRDVIGEGAERDAGRMER